MTITKRAVGMALCAVVGGTMLAAGIRGLTREMSLSADLVPPPPPFPGVGRMAPAASEASSVQVLPRAEVLRRTPSTSAVPGFRPVEPAAVVPPVSAECGAVREMAAQVYAAINRVLPVRSENVVDRNALRAAVAASVVKYCVGETQPQEHASAPVDNNCEQYSERTARWAACMGEQQQGRVYDGAK